MQRLEVLPFLAVLLLALDSSEAFLHARERSEAKKREAHTSDAPYVCLDTSANLPTCNFEEEADGESVRKPSRQLRSLDPLRISEDMIPIGDTEASRATTVIYKIEGCIPSRLPFVLPVCKTEDSVGKIVEVRRLFPFRLAGPLAQNSDAPPTLVFPEVDTSQWYRFVRGLWNFPIYNDANAAQSGKVRREVSAEKQKAVGSRKTTKRKKAVDVHLNDKKIIRQKFAEGFASKVLEENDIFSEFPSPIAARQQADADRAADTNSYKMRSSRLNRIVDALRKPVAENAFAAQQQQQQQRHEFLQAEAILGDPGSLRFGSEFPYSRAISYDPKKLQVAEAANEFPYDHSISYDPNKLRVSRIDTEFPYDRAISYDPEKLERARIGSEFPYGRAISFDPEKLQVPRFGSEFPYNRALSYDPEKLRESRIGSEFRENRGIFYGPAENLRVAGDGSEFPYGRAIPFDSTKLRVVKRGSSLGPYSRSALPYDSGKLDERRSFVLAVVDDPPFSSRRLRSDDARAKPQSPTVVPFDSSMLDAAKDGGIFPYGKEIPDDTSKIVEAIELPRSSDPERVQVPVRHVKMYWDDDFSARSGKLPAMKEHARLERLRSGRELRENLVSSRDDPTMLDYGRYYGRVDGASRARAPRGAANAESSGNASSASGSVEIPNRWIEFPYSKAIPFDPEKLRRPRSLTRDDLDSSVAIPQAFPYDKAIPYDSWKFAARDKQEKSSGRRDDPRLK